MNNIDFTFFDRVPDSFDLGNRMGTTDYIDFLTYKRSLFNDVFFNYVSFN